MSSKSREKNFERALDFRIFVLIVYNIQNVCVCVVYTIYGSAKVKKMNVLEYDVIDDMRMDVFLLI